MKGSTFNAAHFLNHPPGHHVEVTFHKRVNSPKINQQMSFKLQFKHVLAVQGAHKATMLWCFMHGGGPRAPRGIPPRRAPPPPPVVSLRGGRLRTVRPVGPGPDGRSPRQSRQPPHHHGRVHTWGSQLSAAFASPPNFLYFPTGSVSIRFKNLFFFKKKEDPFGFKRM